MSVETRLDAALASDAAVQTLFNELVAGGDTADLTALVDRLLAAELPQTRVRQLFVNFVRTLTSLGLRSQGQSCFEETALHTLGKLKSQQLPNDEADYILREALFEYYLSLGEYAEAAQVLSGINLESTSRVFTDAEKVDVLVKISEAFLEDVEHVEKAELFVTKASALMNNVSDLALQLRYRTTSARVLDLNRKFVDAAQRFYELSCMTNANVTWASLG